MANTDLPPGGIEIHFRRHGPIQALKQALSLRFRSKYAK
jgi:hypothetical protein